MVYRYGGSRHLGRMTGLCWGVVLQTFIAYYVIATYTMEMPKLKIGSRMVEELSVSKGL